MAFDVNVSHHQWCNEKAKAVQSRPVAKINCMMLSWEGVGLRALGLVQASHSHCHHRTDDFILIII